MRTVYAKLSVALLLLLLVLGTVAALLTVRTSRLYLLEVQQKLHRGLAAKVLEDQPLLQDASGRDQALDRIFEKLMLINPGIEVYLLDAEGRILGYSAPPGRVQVEAVDLGPVRQLLDPDARLPILGSDPRHPGADNIFSVAPLSDDANHGYLYIVLASEQLDSVASMLDASYILRTAMFMVAGSLILTLVGGLAMFRGLTGRLRRLAGQIREFEARMLHGDGVSDEPRSGAGSPSIGAAAGLTRTPRGDAAPPDDEIDALERGFHDMSRRISRQLAQLEAQDKERRDLLTNISHDVRTPLTHLQGYLETMLLKGEELSDGERREYLRIAVQRSEQLGRLVADLLELAKLDAPERLMEKERFSIGELVQDAAQQFQLEAADKDVELELHVDGTPAPVRGNLGALERALQNLIDNAVRYAGPGDRVDVVVESDGEEVRVIVRDTGPGIPQHQLEHVFDRFYRGREGDGDAREGSGLGLAIAQRAIDLHGGELVCESRVGEGTTFRFSLPCDAAGA